jgi:hypothetical protein
VAFRTADGLSTWTLISALSIASLTAQAPPQRAKPQPGISGLVVAPDGTPVSAGIVAIESTTGRATAAIDRTGHFRLVPGDTGLQQLFVRAPGLAPYRVIVAIPASKTVPLSPIHLAPASYFRARFVTPAGDLIATPRVRHQSFDASGVRILEPPELAAADQIDGDGFVVLGPLPLGRTSVAFDTPPHPVQRLTDVEVTDAGALLDGGTNVVQRGATLHVDVADETGTAVALHDVFIEDARPLSPIGSRRAQTNQRGRATFDRMAAGRYRIRSRTVDRCDGRPLAVERVISVSGSGNLSTQLIIGGTANFHVASSFGPLSGTFVSATPHIGDAAASRSRFELPPLVRRPAFPLSIETSCGGWTDADGRLTLSTFPPGPARINVRLQNSTYIRQVNAGLELDAIALHIPGGILPLRVTDALTMLPVASAEIAWHSAGARIEARTNANGEALLEAVGTAPGKLVVRAGRYQTSETDLPEPPSAHEVVLRPESRTELHARVVSASGEAVVNAVVELVPADPRTVGRIATTNASGEATFANAPPGAIRVIAGTDGVRAAAIDLPATSRGAFTITLPIP